MGSVAIVALWAGLNLGLTLLLALQVSRHRFRARVPLGEGEDEKLHRALRAHGNNTEYVPSLLLALLLLALLGESKVVLHVAGGGLFIARILHAYGIQIPNQPAPAPRVLGNIFTWLIFLLLVVRLVFMALTVNG